MTKGIDVSKHNGNIDWAKVKAAGVDFAIIRAGYGNDISQKDKFFDANVKGAKANGIKIGAYWFSYAISAEDAKKEANACAEVIKGIDFELPVFFDFEYDSIKYAEKNGIKITKTLASDIAIAFLEAMKAKGYAVGNYVNPDFIKNKFDDRIKQYDTWIAHYKDNPDTSKKYEYAGFNIVGWQYSSTGKVDGISGNVDMNVFYIDAEKEETKPSENTPVTNTGLKAGQAVYLSNAPIYSNASTVSVASRKTGTFYLWSNEVVGKRVRITNSPDRIGKVGQVAGWINVSDITTATATTKKSVIVIAKEVIQGKWGNGNDRKKRLEAAGYNYTEVQSMVNKLL